MKCCFASILLLYTKRAILSQLYLDENKLYLDDMMTIMSALFQNQNLKWQPLKQQQSLGRHVAALGQIILIFSQLPVFALTAQCSVFSGEATNTNLIDFGLTRPRLELMIYRTRGEHANHYTIDASLYKILSIFTIKVNIRYNIRIHQYDTISVFTNIIQYPYSPI